MLRWLVLCAFVAQTLSLPAKLWRDQPEAILWRDQLEVNMRPTTPLAESSEVNIHPTTPDTEPSMVQLVDKYRSGMPTWLQEELNETFKAILERDQSEVNIRLTTPHAESSEVNIHPTTPDTEPSMVQLVDMFRSGMPTWLQEELNETFAAMKEEIEEGRMVNYALHGYVMKTAQEWWDRWSSNRNTESSTLTGTTSRPITPRRRPTTPRQRPASQNNQTQSASNHTTNKEIIKWYNKTSLSFCRHPFRPLPKRVTREEPEFKVLCGGNDYEARLYNRSVWVSVKVKALTYDLALGKAYMKLYYYIHGNNHNNSEVTRTVPVHSRVRTNAINNRWFQQYNYTVSFYLPKDVHDNYPLPRDPQLFIEDEEPSVYYAHIFRGYALEFNIWEYLRELTDALDVNLESYLKEDFVVNVYDAPWRLLNRRNEILVSMDNYLLETPRCMNPSTEAPTTSTVSTTTVKATTDTLGVLPPVKINDQGPQNSIENNDVEQPSSVECEPGSICPSYSTTDMCDGFELRQYTYSRWICMNQAACNLEKAQTLTQRTLLKYFNLHGNRNGITMTPTTPYVMGLDVSDLNRTDCGKVYTSCMFIPEEHQDDPPTPRNAALYIQDLSSLSRYVMPFDGSATSQNVLQFGVDFLMALDRLTPLYDGSIIAVAQYTTPEEARTRRNELWVTKKLLLPPVK